MPREPEMRRQFRGNLYPSVEEWIGSSTPPPVPSDLWLELPRAKARTGREFPYKALLPQSGSETKLGLLVHMEQYKIKST